MEPLLAASVRSALEAAGYAARFSDGGVLRGK